MHGQEYISTRANRNELIAMFLGLSPGLDQHEDTFDTDTQQNTGSSKEYLV